MNEIFLQPGFIVVPSEPSVLVSAVGSGIAVTIYDLQKSYGGMAYFVKAKGLVSTPFFAKPAILGMLNIFLKRGSNIENLEAHFYGGASNSNIKSFNKDVSRENIDIVKKILTDNNISITGVDIGGKLGRKVAFNSSTGEVIVAKIKNIRESDWYPETV